MTIIVKIEHTTAGYDKDVLVESLNSETGYKTTLAVLKPNESTVQPLYGSQQILLTEYVRDDKPLETNYE